MTGLLCIELHDVAAATWPQCRRLLGLIDELGAPPVTLLAVPDHHRRGSLASNRALVDALDRRLGDGDEVALHGLYHVDDARAPTTPIDWARRRCLTAREGEFAALSEAEALRRLCIGYQALCRLGWPVRGFVAPAWLSNASTWQALRHTPLHYAATRSEFVTLLDFTRIRAPAISVSARAAWRRAASRMWLHAAQRALARQRVVRLALHPVDAEHAQTLRDWRACIGHLLRERTAVTASNAVAA